MALTDTFVDPDIDADSGTGTIGDPYGDTQFALDDMTRDSTNGDRINIKAGTDEVATAAINLTSYGTPTEAAPILIQGYTSAVGDGGIFGVDGNSGAYNVFGFSGLNFTHFAFGHIFNSQRQAVLAAGVATYYALEINDVGVGSFDGLNLGNSVLVAFCHFHDIAGDGVVSSGGGLVTGCYFKNDGTKDFTTAINFFSGDASNNIISIDGASDGITIGQGGSAKGNSILSSSGTGQGIHPRVTGESILSITNNIVEGFSGTGGVGIDLSASGTVCGLLNENAYFNNTTNQSAPGAHIIRDSNNESLSGTGFEKSGPDTFANRFIFFAPKDEGNTQDGGFPETS